MDPVAALLTAAGAGFLALGLFLRRRTRRFLARAERASATVTDAIAPTSDLTRQARSRLRFVAHNGRTYTFDSRLGLSGGAYARGQRIEVRYDPRNPADAVIDRFIELHAPWLLPTLLGAGLLMAGLLLLFARF